MREAAWEQSRQLGDDATTGAEKCCSAQVGHRGHVAATTGKDFVRPPGNALRRVPACAKSVSGSFCREIGTVSEIGRRALTGRIGAPAGV